MPAEDNRNGWSRVRELAGRSPLLGVVEAFTHLEVSLVQAAAEADLPAEDAVEALVLLIDRKLLPTDLERIYRGLRRLRDSAAHGRLDPDPDAAVEFVDTAQRLTEAVRRKGMLPSVTS